eukprot:c19101_g3_i1.p1 GENE.c19101_g3_i1~~c19101_g3_i1.p1  ORF type:complete len:448 (-),score=191.81 c19101_g3_i1:143-1405(-)
MAIVETPTVTYGALARIMNGERGFKPTVMILSVKKSKPTKAYQKQASITVGDGDMYMAAIISPAMQNGLKQNSIITINEFVCQETKEQKVLCILDLTCYEDEDDNKKKLPLIKPSEIPVQSPAPLQRQHSKLSKEDEDIPPKLHRGTSFGTGSRESLFSTNSAQEREIVREFVTVSALHQQEEDIPQFIHKTHSDGFYRPVTHIKTNPLTSQTKEQGERSDEEDTPSLLEKIRRTASAGSAHFKRLSSKFLLSVLSEKNGRAMMTKQSSKYSKQSEDEYDEQPPPPPIITEQQIKQQQQEQLEEQQLEEEELQEGEEKLQKNQIRPDKQVVVMRQLNDPPPKGYQRSISRPWIFVKSLSFTKKSTHNNNKQKKDQKNEHPNPPSEKRTFRSVVGFGMKKDKKKPIKSGLIRSFSAIFQRK